LLEFYIKSTDPRSHIQLCDLISLTGAEILDDKFGDLEAEGYYGMFLVKGSEESFELISEFPDIIIEIPPNKLIR
jgi:hypothetical protein